MMDDAEKDLIACNGVTFRSIFSNSEDEFRKKINNAIEFANYNDQFTNVTGFVRVVRPLNQVGPTCGLVALHMGIDSLGFKTESIKTTLAVAQQCGYTRQGEMFSSSWLSKLAAKLSENIETEVCKMPTGKDLKSLLHSNNLILVPYDCDRNFSPAQRGGHSAHWCLIVGYLTACFSLIGTSGLRSYKGDLHVFCVHGKSRRLQIWDYNLMKSSNENLFDVSESIRRNIGDYAMPPGGLDNLRNSCVILRKKQNF